MQDCRVYFRDRSGIEHGAKVHAVNRYHAFGLAMAEMKKCSWCNPDFREVQKMTVQILDGPLKGRRVVVTREQFEEWLKTKPGPGESDRQREYLLMLLGRIEPSRDFKRGMAAR